VKLNLNRKEVKQNSVSIAKFAQGGDFKKCKGEFMKGLMKDLAQLEVAGELIEKNTTSTSRLALFLIDNVAELIMYKNVMDEFRRDDHYILKPSKYTAKKKEEIKKLFKPKVNFLVNDLSKITESDGFVLKVGHYLRNEAYHNGIIRDRIITPITRTYFQTICKLFPSLWSRVYVHFFNGEEKEFYRRYGIGVGGIDHNVLAEIGSKILRDRGCKECELANAIAEDLVIRLQETLEYLEYLPSGKFTKSPADTLKWLQFIEKGGSESKIISDSPEEFRLFWKGVEEKFNIFQPKITLETCKIWLAKATDIRNEKDSGIILEKFWEIDRQYLPIENLVTEVVNGYEMEIDRQIHG